MGKGRKGRRRSGLERVVGGVTTLGVLAGLYYVLPLAGLFTIPWPALGFFGLFFGVFPILGGIRQGVGELAERRYARQEALEDQKNSEVSRRDSLEKTVLQVAKNHQGVVTPAHVVLETDLKLEEAEQVLQGLAARNYAEMRVKQNGTIDYVFHDLAD